MSRNRCELTAREIQVLALAADGEQDKEIALAIGIAHDTVKDAMCRVLVKMDSRNRTEAAVKAVRAGLL